jgi:exosortase/archaeosortase family protein
MLVLAPLALALSPAASYWWRRLGDGSDDPLAPLALVAVLAGMLPELARATPGPVDLRLPAACTLAYAAAVLTAPPLVCAALALAALGTTLAALTRRPLTAPRAGLLALALPVVATAQFFLGYPLRRLATLLASRLVAPIGIPARPVGVTLELGEAARVVVDAPCAGVRTLWMAAFVALLVASRRRAGAAGTARLLLLATGGAVLANGLRAAALVVLEVGPWPPPPWLHEGVGLTCFAALAAGLVLAGPVLAGAEPAESTPGPTRRRGQAAFAAALALALAAPWIPREASPPPAGFPGFPATLEGHPLEPLPLGAAELRAARGFPGHVGRFRWRGGELVLTWVGRATRALHPARDCYRALGHEVTALPPDQDAAGRPRGRLRVGGSLVHEQVVAADGEAYEDVGRWIWAAMAGGSPGPWWALRYQGPGPAPTIPEGMLGSRP